MKYWINTITKEHVLGGIEGGFTQANHGSDRVLKKLQNGDAMLFYSGKNSFDDTEPYQKFTALGIVVDDIPYQVTTTDTFHPFRRNLQFLTIEEAAIRPMIHELSFIKDPKHWGFPFMRGLFEIPKKDFEIIARACGVEFDDFDE
jgi:hypothetical protein